MSRNADLWVGTDPGVITSLSRLSHLLHHCRGRRTQDSARISRTAESAVDRAINFKILRTIYNFNPSGELWQFESGNMNDGDFGPIIRVDQILHTKSIQNCCC
jgi:hypothetical protein